MSMQFTLHACTGSRQQVYIDIWPDGAIVNFSSFDCRGQTLVANIYVKVYPAKRELLSYAYAVWMAMRTKRWADDTAPTLGRP